MKTLREAQEWLAGQATNNGARCPCCNQYTKVYRRQINSGMARSLIAMYLHGPQGQWVHLPTQVGARSREEGKLRYWGLVEEQVDVQRSDGGRAGYWRLTPAGRAWVTGQSTVPKFVAVYNNTVLRKFGDPIHITHALGDRFNYGELMAPYPMGTAMKDNNQPRELDAQGQQLANLPEGGADPGNTDPEQLIAPLDPADDVYSLVDTEARTPAQTHDEVPGR
jgi:hypothetical protein